MTVTDLIQRLLLLPDELNDAEVVLYDGEWMAYDPAISLQVVDAGNGKQSVEVSRH